MDIRFYQKDGRIGAVYRLTPEEIDEVLDKGLVRPHPAPCPFFDEIDIGFVPEEVQELGDDHIQAYARRICHERHKEHVAQAQGARNERWRRTQNINRVIVKRYEGIPLQGRIVNHESGGVIVKLEEPFASEKGCIFKYPTCFGESMIGRRVFDLNTGELTNFVLQDAGDALIRLYKEERNKQKYPRTMKLLKELNVGVDD